MSTLFLWISVLFFVSFSVPAKAQNSGLIGFWNFSETSGNIAHDSSGSGINGTLSSSQAVFAPGAGFSGGGAISISSGGYVDLGNNFAFSGTQPFSVQVWFNTAQTAGGILAARHYSNNQDGFFLQINNPDPGCENGSYNNKAAAYVGNDGPGCAGSFITTPSSTVINDAKWHQEILVFNGGLMSLYVDGSLQGSATGATLYACPTVDFIIGGFNTGNGGCGVGTPTGDFSGLITDVGVWNIALSAAQVAALYQNPNNPSLGGTQSPAITPNGIVSATAFGAFSSIAPGDFIEIYGSNLASNTRTWGSNDFAGVNAPTSLDGTSVSIGGQEAFVAYISPGQVNALVPSTLGIGPQQLTVTTALGTTAAVSVNVNSTEPGILATPTFKVGGTQYTAAFNADGSYVLPAGAIAGLTSHPAKPGDTIVLYGLGFGPVTPDIPAGQVVQQANSVGGNLQFSIGGMAASATYKGLAPGYTGLYQFNVLVPNVPAANAVPLTFTLNGATGTQSVSIAVNN